MEATPMQLVFGKDTILNIKHEANWKYIHERRNNLIKKNNEKENKKRKIHHYKIGLKMEDSIWIGNASKWVEGEYANRSILPYIGQYQWTDHPRG
eukprot:7914181-Ditylum_brightwellii.AAC.1